MSTIIGVDIGTSVTKAVAFDGTGGALASASRRSHLDMLPGGRVEQDLGDVVAGVGDVVREAAAAVGRPPDAVALTGQGTVCGCGTPRAARCGPLSRGWTRGPRTW